MKIQVKIEFGEDGVIEREKDKVYLTGKGKDSYADVYKAVKEMAKDILAEQRGLMMMK